jgi:hypothetical protein
MCVYDGSFLIPSLPFSLITASTDDLCLLICLVSLPVSFGVSVWERDRSWRLLLTIDCCFIVVCFIGFSPNISSLTPSLPFSCIAVSIIVLFLHVCPVSLPASSGVSVFPRERSWRPVWTPAWWLCHCWCFNWRFA